MKQPGLTKMKTAISACIFATALVAASAFAHTDLTRSVPAADAELDSPPTTVTLEYGDDVKLIRVQLLLPDGEKLNLPLDRASPPGKSTVLAIPRTIDAGSYQVNWSAIGEDGHIMTGEFGFSVR